MKQPETNNITKPLPGPVQEAIDAYARYYADHHCLGMSIRNDMIYVAQVAMRWSSKDATTISAPNSVVISMESMHTIMRVLTFLKAVLIGNGFQKDSSSINQLEIAYSMLHDAQATSTTGYASNRINLKESKK